MKKILTPFLVAIICVLCQNLYSQQYQPMDNPGVTWFETYTNYTPSPYGYNTCGQKYLNGDTIINSLSYKKIYHERLDVYCTEIVLNGPEYAGAIREDISQQKAWYIYPTTDLELLYFDFSLTIGDTILADTYFAQNSPLGYLIISDVDTIVTNDGIERRRWLFDMDPYSDESFVIEGLGCSSGLLATYEVLFEYANYLANFHNDTTLIYCSDYIGCELPTDTCATVTIDEKIVDSKITIYPNPAFSGNQVKISHNPPIIDGKVTIEIFDMLGKKTVSFSENNSQDITFLAPCKSGIYLMNFTNANFKQTIKLIVK